MLSISHLTREGDVPLIDFPLHRDRLNLAFQGTVQLDFGMSYLGEMQELSIEFPTRPIRVGEAIIAVFAFEARVAWLLPIAHPSKESIKGFVESSQSILKDMSGDLFVLWPHFVFNFWKVILLLIDGFGWRFFARWGKRWLPKRWR